ncbi:MAG: hypothetical protein Q2306_02305 [Phytoplasma sp.]|uniref:hypothetical protein n=1 Tax=Phytoplasma sp. TaxID=2155 RepID=UPI002B405F44|nr:hypothetical protein [Phytoplasma sp.]WRH06703.1 MAG: hypothetical protein Q2306_02305 [Phytoplasma sp.]
MLIFILPHNPIYAHNYFDQKTKSKIKLIDYETLQQEWLNTQPKLKRYDINILEKDDIPNILKYYDVTCTSAFPTPSYNAFKQNNLYWYLKNPPQGLLGVYFKSRPNPFKSSYPATDYQYSLEGLLKYEIAIEEAFIFWDVKQKPNEDNPNIQLIVSNIFVGQNKEEIINQYLINNNNIKEPKLIKLGCYNTTPNAGLVVPLPQENLNDVKIDAIYFDDGIRIMSESPEKQHLKRLIKTFQKIQQRRKQLLKEIEVDNLKQLINEQIKKYEERINTYKQELNQLPGTIEDLLKLSNGAKNIYLFVFNTQKRAIHINLPDSVNPYEAIRDWKRDNNLFEYVGEYKEEKKEEYTRYEDYLRGGKLVPATNETFIFSKITNFFETEDKIYHITCQDRYQKKAFLEAYQEYDRKLQVWKNQCYFKPGKYSAFKVREILGRNNTTIYSNGDGYVKLYGRLINGEICRSYIYYEYKKGWLFDDWYFNDILVGVSDDGFLMSVYFGDYFDTTKPPTPPPFPRS